MNRAPFYLKHYGFRRWLRHVFYVYSTAAASVALLVAALIEFICGASLAHLGEDFFGLVVAVSKHYTTMINGIVRDTFNPGDRGTTIYPPHTAPDALPKGAYLLSNGNGWAYAPGRCVYGYWIFKGDA